MATCRSSETTSPKAATAAFKTLRNPNASPAAKSAAGAALAQVGNTKTTSSQAATAASEQGSLLTWDQQGRQDRYGFGIDPTPRPGQKIVMRMENVP
jgi:hypothetical protein